jgi:hypothetical protein
VSATVVEVLDAQHRRVAQLFERVSSPGADRPTVLNSLLKELAAYVAAERAAVVPVVSTRRIPHLLALGPVADKLTAVASRWDALRDRTVNNRHPESSSQGNDPGPGGPGMGGSPP